MSTDIVFRFALTKSLLNQSWDRVMHTGTNLKEVKIVDSHTDNVETGS